MAESYYDEVGWDPIEAEDEIPEYEVSEPLVQVGRDHAPRHPQPEGLSPREKALFTKVWGQGEPIVTPWLAERLSPGELELYSGALNAKLRHYAWSRVDAYGSAIVDAESLVQDALIARWLDPRDLEPDDIERFAINLIRQRSMDATREFKRRGSGPEDEQDPVFYGEDGKPLPWESNPYVASEPVPRVLPENWSTKIRSVLSAKTAEAVRLVLEEQYTQAEAAQVVGLRQSTVAMGFKKLKEKYGL